MNLCLQKRFLLFTEKYLKDCKPDSHKTLYEWVDDFERLGEVETIIINEWTGKKNLRKQYRFVNQVPLRNTDEESNVIYRNSFATDYLLDRKNIKQIIEAGRTRWKIEMKIITL